MHGPGMAAVHQHHADLRLGIVLSTSTVLPLQAAGGAKWCPSQHAGDPLPPNR